MHDARAVCNFFLARAEEKNASITIMTLLKVLFFAHAWHLAQFGRPLVGQPFEAWKHGPVNRVVYEQYKDCKDQPIKKLAVSFDPVSMQYRPSTGIFNEITKHFLENIFDYYTQFGAFKLSDLTHEVGGPWHQVWLEAGKRAVPGMVIPNELIETWFKDTGALYWVDRERRYVS